MRNYYRMLMDEDERNEADRLNAEERAEREPEPATETPLERWCCTNPVWAASQIQALQEAVREMAPYWHEHSVMSPKHTVRFSDCTMVKCRRLRVRLRPFPK